MSKNKESSDSEKLLSLIEKDKNLPVVFTVSEVENLHTLLYMLEMSDSEKEPVRIQFRELNRQTRNKLREKILNTFQYFRRTIE